MTWLAFLLVAFLCGSLPFSVWLGKLFLDVDVRSFGDRNPGAANAFRAGSKLVGLLALILDISKAAAPVGLAYFNLGIRGVPMFLIALAPILGHVFSPFLRFRGGKALATALGVWIGLTIWKVSLPAAIAALVGIALFTPPGWAVMFALGIIFIVLLLWMPVPLYLFVLAGETLLLAWTHRADLRQGPRLRPWLAKRYLRVRDREQHG
jgi:acyl phosphate:glycerol-3-phosphate acyltransferase